MPPSEKLGTSKIDRLTKMLFATQQISVDLSNLLMESYARSDRLYDVTLRALVGLTRSACLTCGAEPGCNIDCPGCKWVVDAQDALGVVSLSDALVKWQAIGTMNDPTVSMEHEEGLTDATED